MIPISPKSSTSSNKLEATPTVNAAKLLSIAYAMFDLQSFQAAILALRKIAENILPDLCITPSDEGTLAFYDFEHELTEEDVQKAIAIIKVLVEPRLVFIASNNIKIGYIFQYAITQSRAGYATPCCST